MSESRPFTALMVKARRCFDSAAMKMEAGQHHEATDDMRLAKTILERIREKVSDPELDAMVLEAEILFYLSEARHYMKELDFPRYYSAKMSAREGLVRVSRLPDSFSGFRGMSKNDYTDELLDVFSMADKRMYSHEERREDIMERMGDVISYGGTIESNHIDGFRYLSEDDWNRAVDEWLDYSLAEASGDIEQIEQAKKRLREFYRAINRPLEI